MNEFVRIYLPWIIIVIGIISFGMYYRNGMSKKKHNEKNKDKLNNNNPEKYERKLFDFEEVKGYNYRKNTAYRKWENEKNNLKENNPYSHIFMLCPLCGCFIGIAVSNIFDFELSYGVMYGILIGICAGTFMMRKNK